MADDVLLWFILAAAIAFVWCGCIFTARDKKTLEFAEGAFDREVDRAA